MRMGALRFLTALKKSSGAAKKKTEKGLLFVDASFNGKAAKSVMVDTGATHNFVSKAEAAQLGLKLVGDDTGKMKAVNSKAMATVGAAKQVRVKLGTWVGTTDLIVVPMDDFDVVLGMKFLLEKSAIPVPTT